MYKYILYVILLTHVTVTNAKNLVCYQCRGHCRTSVDIECPSHSVMLFGSERDWRNIQGCYKSNTNCTNIYKVKFNGDDVYCNSCKGDYCNRDVLQELCCYMCNECSRVNMSTTTMACRAVDCRYSAYVQIVSSEFKTVNGCVDNCTQTCPKVRKPFLPNYPKGMFGKCVSCSRGKCNKIQIKLRCYQCENCMNITSTTPTVNCKMLCCYSVGNIEATRLNIKRVHTEAFCTSLCSQHKETIKDVLQCKATKNTKTYLKYSNVLNNTSTVVNENNRKYIVCIDCNKARSEKKKMNVLASKSETFLSRTLLSIDMDENDQQHMDNQPAMLENEDTIESSKVLKVNTTISTNITNYLGKAYKLIDLEAHNTSNGIKSNHLYTNALVSDKLLFESFEENKNVPTDTSRLDNDEQEVNHKSLDSSLKSISNEDKGSHEHSEDLNPISSPKIVTVLPLIGSTSLHKVPKNLYKFVTKTFKSARIDIVKTAVTKASHDRRNRGTTLISTDIEGLITFFSNRASKREAASFRIGNTYADQGKVLENAYKHASKVSKIANYSLERGNEFTTLISSNTATVSSKRPSKILALLSKIAIRNKSSHKINSKRAEPPLFDQFEQPLDSAIPSSESIECYDCAECSSTKKNTPTTQCATNCCYTAVWMVNNVLNNARQCADNDVTTCKNYCNEIAELVISNNNGVLRYCRSCSENRCNHENTDGVISCYQCEDCETPNVVECAAGCCYTAKFEGVNGLVRTSRNCADVQPGRTCRVYCEFLQSDKCSVCTTDKCNSIANCYSCEGYDSITRTTQKVMCSTNYCYSIRTNNLTVIRGCATNMNYCNMIENVMDCKVCTGDSCNDYLFEGIECYSCSECDSVETDTDIKICPEAKCCYTLQDTSNNVERDCATNRKCETYCDDITTNSSIQFCNVCSGNKCNSDLISSLTINCYQCSYCDEITEDTTIIECPDGCCFVSQIMFGNGTYWSERKCVNLKPGWSCEVYCARTNKSLHATTTLRHCHVCTTDNCNNISLIIPTMRRKKVIKSSMCYHCFGCYSITKKTRSMFCDSGCCYTAVWIEHGATNVARLCGEEPCKDNCDQINKTLTESDPNGIVHSCYSCLGDGCNKITVYKPTATVYSQQIKFGNIDCYNCTGCDSIVDGLSVVKCSSRCCYAIYLKSNDMAMVERGCAKVEPGRSCGRYCYRRNTTGDMCEVCHENRCNTKEFAAGNSFISCYDCLECNVQPTVLKRCVSKCCYAAIWTENSMTFSGRFCASLDGVKCDGYCRHVETVVTGKMHYCKECEGHLCNNQTMARVQRKDFLTYIECYTCSNCSKNEQNTLAKCKSNCCFDEIFYDGTTVVFERGCAILSPGKPCQRYCSAKEVDYLKSYPTRVVKHCMVCMEDRCNKNVINIPDVNVNISCYDCFDCDERPTNETNVITCPSKCCYSTVWTKNVSISGRFCADLGGVKCEDYCESLEKDADDSIHYCKQCETDRCNNEIMSQRKGLDNQIECYNCTNCNSVDKSTATVQCRSNCCYSGVFHADNRLNISERICASLRPDKPCLSYCSVTEEEYLKLHPRGIMKHCETCSSDRCNKHKPIFVINCYHCYGCYSKPNNAIKKEPCETNCCYSVAWSENNNTISGRLCALKTDLHDKPCVDVCSEFRGLTSINVHDCDSCTDDLCNNKPIKKQHEKILSCYDCKDCPKQTDNTTNTLNCGSNCCYTAINKANAVERSCAKLRPGKTCQNFCTLTSDILKNCTTCTKDLCNQLGLIKSAPVIRTEFIKCYEYFGCYSKPTVRAKVDTCTTNCCFTAKWMDGNETICTRQCATKILLKDLKCNELCKSFKVHKNVKFCKECESEKCNNHVIPLLHTEILKISYLNCYDCKGCDKVEAKKTNITVCKTDCCYTGTKKSGEIERSCAKLRPEITCDNFCQVSKNDMTIVKNCYTCTTELCNAKTSPLIECYYCLECFIKPTGYSERCPSACCSSMVWTDGNRTRSGRGCLELDNPTQTCDTFCDDKDQYCKTCESSKCNNEIIYKDISNKQFKCYNCEDCNDVQKTTATIECQSGCCYSGLNTAGVMTRSCTRLRPGVTCDNFCQVSKSEKILGDECATCRTELCNMQEKLQNTVATTTTTIDTSTGKHFRCYKCNECLENPKNKYHKRCDSFCCITIVYIDGNATMHTRTCQWFLSTCAEVCNSFSSVTLYCRSCTTDRCNNEDMPYDRAYPPGIECYDCKDCKEVDHNTKRIKSEALCCYTTLYQNGSIDRGGAKLRPGITCANFCKLSKIDVNEAKDCKICTTGLCNKDGFDPYKPVNCYSCYGCFSRRTARTNVVYCATGCCYSAVWVKDKTTILRRHCASEDVLNKTTCNALCKTWREKLDVPYCNTCTNEACNNEVIPKTVREEVVNCYDCTGCEVAGDYVTKCSTDCCYSGLNQDGKVVRSCAKLRPGMPCENFCYEAKYDLSVVNDCNVCTKDRCNMESLKNSKPILVAPKGFQCYNCYGCYSPPNHYTPTINCTTHCCYTAVWTDGGSTVSGRLCAPPEKLTLINKACSELCDQFKHVKFCKWCDKDRCNTDTMPHDDAALEKQINCIDCKGCKKPSKNTIKCGTGCCYASLNKKKNITRSCARLRPGLMCDRFCTELIELEDLKDCYACTSDRCNVFSMSLSL